MNDDRNDDNSNFEDFFNSGKGGSGNVSKILLSVKEMLTQSLKREGHRIDMGSPMCIEHMKNNPTCINCESAVGCKKLKECVMQFMHGILDIENIGNLGAIVSMGMDTAHNIQRIIKRKEGENSGASLTSSNDDANDDIRNDKEEREPTESDYQKMAEVYHSSTARMKINYRAYSETVDFIKEKDRNDSEIIEKMQLISEREGLTLKESLLLGHKVGQWLVKHCIPMGNL